MTTSTSHDGQDEGEKGAPTETGRRRPYESFGWRFSGGLLAVRPVSEVMERFTAAVANAFAFVKARAVSVRTADRPPSRGRR